MPNRQTCRLRYCYALYIAEVVADCHFGGPLFLCSPSFQIALLPLFLCLPKFKKCQKKGRAINGLKKSAN